MKFNYLMVLLLKMMYKRLKHLTNFLLVFSLKKLLPTCQACILTMLLIPLVYLIFPLNYIVCSMLHKLDSYKSPGPDGWPLWALKETAESICSSPCLFCIPGHWILEFSLTAGRGSCDVPVYKKDGRSSPNNYRPITLTSVVGKILESIIRDHILDHLIRYNLLSAQQHGFLPGKSCVSQLITPMDH